MIPPRISVMTFNVWGQTRWLERKDALARAIEIADPDCLVLQECSQDILDCLDRTLSGHSRIMDHPEKGWITESNIYFRSAYFEKETSGFVDLEMTDHPDRGLFWVRLRERQLNKCFVVATVHMPWPGCAEELKTGINQRVVCSRLLALKLKEITKSGEPCILGGDFNESFHPQRILRELASFEDVFECLDLPPPITHPVRTTAEFETSMPDMTCDWIMISNCHKCIASFAKTIRGPIIPSDHLSVIAIIEPFESKEGSA